MNSEVEELRGVFIITENYGGNCSAEQMPTGLSHHLSTLKTPWTRGRIRRPAIMGPSSKRACGDIT